MKELRTDPEFAVECLKLALESLDDPDERGGSLLMLRALAEAYGGLGAVAAKAGISRESLYRSLSPKGNPTLKTLVAVLNTMGLRLSVVPQPKKGAQTGREETGEISACQTDARQSHCTAKNQRRRLHACAARHALPHDVPELAADIEPFRVAPGRNSLYIIDGVLPCSIAFASSRCFWRVGMVCSAYDRIAGFLASCASFL